MLKRIIYKKSRLEILDQRLLPHKIKYITAKTPKETARAISNMAVRGAPLIGCTAAYGYALALKAKPPKSLKETINMLDKAALTLKSSRPTAVALGYAIDRLQNLAKQYIKTENFSQTNLKKLIILIDKEADAIYKEDINACKKLSELGSKFIKGNVMTICNAGALATAGIGTALGVIYKAFKKGRIKKVYVCETRPYLQGARLTMFELMQNKIPAVLITDNMTAHIIKTCKINAIIAGADRIASNGDTANKIGTYMLAVLAKFHKVPFYIAAPTPTIDFSISDGQKIPIEERPASEVSIFNGKKIAPKKALIRHPAFDITPVSLIKAIITEKGILKPARLKTLIFN